MNPLDEVAGALRLPDAAARAAVEARAAQVLRPPGALARLDELAAWMAAWQSTVRPHVDRPVALVFAADHGIASATGVSAYPTGITATMLDAFRAGVSSINVMADALGALVCAVDVGVGRPTNDFRHRAAMDPKRFHDAVQAGRDAVANAAAENGADVVVLGEMGIGNTSAAAAVCASLCGGETASWVGRGTGVDDDGLAHKVAAIDAARKRLAAARTTEPLEVLREVGGLELAALAGAIVEARTHGLPVVLDGYVTAAAAIPLALVNDDALAHCVAGHCSAEPGHRLVLDRLGMAPLLSLGLRLGEGSGAMAALPLLTLACRLVADVPTFAEWLGADAPR